MPRRELSVIAGLRRLAGKSSIDGGELLDTFDSF
jgi:hypothetical protein